MKDGLPTAATLSFILASSILLILVLLSAPDGPGGPLALAAAPPQAPTVTGVVPSSAGNDQDTPVAITGAGFTATVSGTVVITPPTVQLGNRTLAGNWVSSTTLTATVPGGMDPGVYTMSVTNPDGQSGSLTNAFTVTQALGVWTTGGPYGGQIWDLVQHPLTPTVLYASVHNTGIFVSEDAGENWRAIAVDNYPLRMSMDPQGETLYLGGQNNLYRSRDNGTTWDRISPPPQRPQLFTPVPHPTSAGTLYVGASAAPSGPIGPGEEGGIYRSSDYGTTWITRTNGLTDTHVTALAFYPGNPDRMVAGTREGNVFVSANGGESWAFAARVSSHIERLYVNPFGANEVWAVTDMAFWPASPPFLYRSQDAGLTTWISATMTTNPGAPAWLEPVRSLAFHPAISGTLWAAAGPGYVTRDGGQTWSPVGAPRDVRSFSVDASNTNTIYAGTSTSVYKSTDGGATWNETTDGLAGVVPHALAGSRANPDEVYASTDVLGLLKSNNGGRSWQQTGISRRGFPWQGTPLAVDPFSPAKVYFGNQCSEGPCVRVSSNAGTTWQSITLTLPITLTGWTGDVFAVKPDPAVRGRLLAGATFYPPGFDWTAVRRPLGGIYASDDYGEHWTQMTTTQPISGVVEFAYDAVDPKLVSAGTEGTGLWKSADGGATWQPVTVSSDPATRYVWSVAANPRVGNAIWVGVWGGGSQPAVSNVFTSTDAGANWAPVTWPGKSGGFRTMVFAPTRSPALYVGTEGGGLYRTPDDGQTWEHISAVPGNGTLYSLAAGKDLHRVAVYVGVTAGLGITGTQSSGVASTRSLQASSGTAMGGGVYRLVTSLPVERVYLPALYKQYGP